MLILSGVSIDEVEMRAWEESVGARSDCNSQSRVLQGAHILGTKNYIFSHLNFSLFVGGVEGTILPFWKSISF